MTVVPQSGQLTCTTHCRCHLEPADKPKARALGTIQRWSSIATKPFTGTERDKRGRVLVTRENVPRRRRAFAKRARSSEHRHVRRGG